jgi:hypothetical protein
VADDLHLIRPLGIDQAAWTAIVGHRDRLGEARRGADGALLLGRGAAQRVNFPAPPDVF